MWYLAEGATGPGGGDGDIELRVRESAGTARDGEITTSGVPLPKELGIYSSEGLSLYGADGSPVPLQARVTARWGGAPHDTSKAVKWVLLDFTASVAANGESVYYLRRAGVGPCRPRPSA